MQVADLWRDGGDLVLVQVQLAQVRQRQHDLGGQVLDLVRPCAAIHSMVRSGQVEIE